MSFPLDVPLELLRARRSAKWTTYAPDVLPLPVAEMDVRLAPAVSRALQTAVDLSDSGYAGDTGGLVDAFAGFARRRWQWHVAPTEVRTCADVAVGVTEVLRLLVAPGDGVVLMPPVYPPFWHWLDAVGARPVEVRLRDVATGGRLDLAGIERALEAGVRVILLCHPHNPTGRVHDVAELRALAQLADEHGALVLSDEIHAPLTFAQSRFHPYVTVSAEAARTGIAFHSASKAWNLAGLKCALVVAVHPQAQQAISAWAPELAYGTGHLGVLTSTAAYRHGEEWLDDLVSAVEGNVALLGRLLAERLPEIAFATPQASYLAWLDCRRLGPGADPAAAFRERGRVALSAGPDFGSPGAGYARLNLACSPDLLAEAVTRMAAGAQPPA